jgi:hypothetical protein
MEGDLRMIRLALTCVLSAALPLAAAAKPIPGPEGPAFVPKPAATLAPALAVPGAAGKEPLAVLPARLTGEPGAVPGKTPQKPVMASLKR